jgi:AcrR family transcriptional regulator
VRGDVPANASAGGNLDWNAEHGPGRRQTEASRLSSRQPARSVDRHRAVPDFPEGSGRLHDRAGVSPAAPYRHFKDRDALIADVAERGFEVFAKGLAEAWTEGTPEPHEALLRMGRAYLAFAREEPAYYTAMFESGLSFRDYPSLQEVSDRAFGVLRQACEAVIATLPAEKRPPVMMMALHIWSLTHGLAGLFARGDAARRPIPMAPEDLLEAGILIYFDGLSG